MIIIPKNTATAVERRIPFVLVDATDLITPEDISVTGVKVSMSIGGASAASSTNDIVKIEGSTGRYYIELTQTEANGSAGAMVFGHLAPSGCARAYPLAQIGGTDILTAAATATEIANATVEAEITAVKSYNRSANETATITGPVSGTTSLGITTDATYLPIKTL